MTKIKICGLMQPQDVITACALGADYIGFILSDGFRRTVGLETFCELVRCHADSKSCAKKVGVFVSEPIENILRYAEMLDVIQLHGNEDDAYIAKLKERTGKPVIKAFKVTCAEDVQRAQQSKADCVLLDSGTGTGKLFDHTLIRDIGRPYFLAGGLNPDNVAEAVSALHPYAVDVSSGVETDGRKDPQKMRAFAEAVRSI